MSFCDNSKHGLVVSGQNKMYMAGGEYPDGSASQAFWRYDPVLDVWQEMASMQTPRSELGILIIHFIHSRVSNPGILFNPYTGIEIIRDFRNPNGK